MSVSKRKLTVIDTTGRPTVNTASVGTLMPTQAPAPVPAPAPAPKPDPFAYWGSQAATAKSQGWYPAVPLGDRTIYRSNYAGPHNTIDLGPKGVGHIEVVGKRGNKMDVVIADKDGQTVETVHSNVSPEFVQDYIRNQSSTIRQRVDRLNPESKKK